MAIVKELTPQSWLLETDKGDKLGLVSFSMDTDQYTLIAEDVFLNFGTFEELSTLLGDKVKVEERKEIAVAYNIIEGLPVAHDTAIDVQTADGIVTYRSSEKSATRFFAGYWVIPSSDRTRFSCRLSVSEDIMNLAIKEGYEPKGPFKDKIEAKFTAKQMNAAKNQTK